MPRKLRETRRNGRSGDREVSAHASHSSEDQRASGRPVALFSPKRNEQGNLIRSSVFRNANPSNLRGSLLEGNEDHLLNQARSDLAKRELHVESLNKCIGDLQKRTEAQNRAPQDVQNEFVGSCRKQTRSQEELLRREKALRDTQIRSKHEIGDMKRAQELRVDEVSVQQLRENHETVQQLTFQLQQMQEQMNSMSDSGEFQDVESNYSGRLSHVSSQPAMIPSSCSAATKGCRLIHGINLEYRKTFLEINFLRLIHLEIFLKEFHLTTRKETEKQPLEIRR